MEDLECGQQDYDFMKENLLLFYSNNGEVKRLGGKSFSFSITVLIYS